MEELINSMSNLIYHIARKFTNDEDMLAELYNQGVLGVYEAYNNYDKKSNVKFSTYSYMYIYGKIYSYYNENNLVATNKDVIKLYKIIIKTRDFLSQELKKEPTIKDISQYLNVDETTINNVINLYQTPVSIDYEQDEYGINLLSDNNSSKILEIRDLLSVLDETEREVIIYKYFNGFSQSEIAKILNTSQSSISREEKKGIEKMRVRSKTV